MVRIDQLMFFGLFPLLLKQIDIGPSRDMGLRTTYPHHYYHLSTHS